jgi:hypothetical protein
MEKKKLLTQIGTISLMHMLCMFRLIIEVKTKPKYITNCLLCVHLPGILNSMEKIIIIIIKEKEKKEIFQQFVRFACYIKYFLFIA